jgi:hypothetical protein
MWKQLRSEKDNCFKERRCKMPGQPNIPGVLVFDVTSLQVFEPAGTLAPDVVIPAGGSFDLKVTFQGSDFIWTAFEGLGIAYNVNFYAEGQGVAAPDYDLGNVTGNLAPGGSPYTDTLTVAAGIPVAGIYDLSCRVTFPAVHGMTGFSAPLYIEVY